MKPREFLPPALLDWLRLLQQRRRFPQASLHTARIGERVFLGHDVRIAAGVEIGHDVRIGDHSYVNAGSVIATADIGKFCSIAYYCHVGAQQHPLDSLSTSPAVGGGAARAGRTVLGNDVWIGTHAVIMPSVTIADGAVIGAGAVVTRDIPPYAIAMGVPARTVRFRFPRAVIDSLLEAEWWNREPREWQRCARIIACTGTAGPSETPVRS